MKNLLTVADLGPDELVTLIEVASATRDMLDRGERPERTLQGRCVANLFFEPSTRTRLSFELAAKRLGADVLTYNPATSSSSKGESLRDTVLTIAAIGADMLVVRHVDDGVPRRVAEWTGAAVVNAGDGTHEHPTQALVDGVTLWRHFDRLEGLQTGIVGDIAHSRVAGSLFHVLGRLGMDLTLIGPDGWLPSGTTHRTTTDLDDVIADLDVVYLLRVQTERGGRITDSYIGNFQLDESRLARMRHDAVILHAGPMNRGVEISDQVADSSRALVLEQVRNGVPTRMAVLGTIGSRL
jgi:aspartate carbamoyltransferase catalytic subunit